MPSTEPSMNWSRGAVEDEPLTWARTRALIRADFQRLLELTTVHSLPKKIYWFMLPNFQAVFQYRLYRYLYVKGWPNTARLMFMFSLYMTGCDIAPDTAIGPGCLIGHGFGVILCGKIGARFSIYGQGGTGGGIGEGDIGGGPGLPVIGDDVVFAVKAMALGPIRVGNRAKLAPGATALSDVPEDALVLPASSKYVKFKIGTESAPAENSSTLSESVEP